MDLNPTQRMLATALADRDSAIDEARQRAERRLAHQLRAIMRVKRLTIKALAGEAKEAELRGLSTRFSIHKLLREHPEEET